MVAVGDSGSSTAFFMQFPESFLGRTTPIVGFMKDLGSSILSKWEADGKSEVYTGKETVEVPLPDGVPSDVFGDSDQQ